MMIDLLYQLVVEGERAERWVLTEGRRMKIGIGDVGLGEGDAGDAAYTARITVEVWLDGIPSRCSATVGAREGHWGSIDAAGCGVRPHLDVWWSDRSDWSSLPIGSSDRVLAALRDERSRLWRVVSAERNSRPADELSATPGRRHWLR